MFGMSLQRTTSEMRFNEGKKVARMFQRRTVVMPIQEIARRAEVVVVHKGLTIQSTEEISEQLLCRICVSVRRPVAFVHSGSPSPATST